MRKTITFGLSIILCLVGSLVLLSSIEVEQVVKAAPPKVTITYNIALVTDDSGLDACFPNNSSPGDCADVMNSSTRPCELLTLRTVADQPQTQEFEVDDTSYTVHFSPPGIAPSPYFNGVTLCDGNVLHRLSIVFNGRKKDIKSQTFVMNFGNAVGDEKVTYMAEDQDLDPPTPVPNDLFPTFEEECVAPMVGDDCARIEIRQIAFITQQQRNRKSPRTVLRKVHVGDLQFQKTGEQEINGVTVINVGE